MAHNDRHSSQGALPVVALLVLLSAIGLCGSIYFGLAKSKAEQSARELRSELDQAHKQASDLQGQHVPPQDSASLFEANLHAHLVDVRSALDAYKKDPSDADKHQLQARLEEFAQFIHAWQQLISAMTPLFDGSISKLTIAGGAGDVAQADQLLTLLTQNSDRADSAVKQAIAGINATTPPKAMAK